MGGFFGVAAKEDCVFDLFFGTDYHSHLGTRRAGMAVYSKEVLIPAAWFVRITISVLPMRRTQMNGDPRIMGDCIIPLRLPHPVWS